MARVFLNPGHAPNGQPDPGAVNATTGLRECDVAAAVGALVNQYLQAAGCEVQVLQHDSLSLVVSTANQWCADLFISIHCNSAANPAAQGAETWYCQGSERGRALADGIQCQLISSVPVIDRGLKIAAPGVNGLYVLTKTDMPACLVELAFISNPGDAQLLAGRQDDFARAVARGITDYLTQ